MTTTRNPWTVLFALCLGQSLVLLNSTVVNVAIPAVSADLGATLDQMLWVVNAYILVITGLTMVGARFGDLFGSKRMYLIGLGVFTGASVACGLAQTPGQLIAARVVQATGSAMLSPQTLTMITRIFPAERRGSALGVWGSFAGISVAVAPTLGGLLVSTLDWRWVFLVNAPIGIGAFVLAFLVVPTVPAAPTRRLDLLGTGLMTAAVLLITYGLIEGEPHQWGAIWGPVTVPMILGAGWAALVAFIFVERERQHREPLLPFAVIRDRNFTLMSGVSAVISCAVGGTFFLVFLHLQVGAGMSALEAGLAVAAAPFVSIFFSPVSGRLTDRFGGKYVLFVGLGLVAAGVGYLALVTRTDSSWLELLPPLLILGVGMGVVFSPGGAIAMRNIGPDHAGAASGLYNLSRMVGGAIGSAAVGALLQIRLSMSMPEATATDISGLPPAVVADAVSFAYLLPVAALLIGMALTLFSRAPAPTPARVPNEAEA